MTSRDALETSRDALDWQHTFTDFVILAAYESRNGLVGSSNRVPAADTIDILSNRVPADAQLMSWYGWFPADSGRILSSRVPAQIVHISSSRVTSDGSYLEQLGTSWHRSYLE